MFEKKKQFFFQEQYKTGIAGCMFAALLLLLTLFYGIFSSIIHFVLIRVICFYNILPKTNRHNGLAIS